MEDVPAARNQGLTSPSAPSSISWGFRNRDRYVVGDVRSVSGQRGKHGERRGRQFQSVPNLARSNLHELHEIPGRRDRQRLAVATPIACLWRRVWRTKPSIHLLCKRGQVVTRKVGK